MTGEGNLRINGARLWDSLMELAKIGATEKGGVNRQALTDLDREGRDLFVRWCEAAGCTVSVDRVGNIFARRAGRDDSLAPVMMGSHLDTQPTGGKFDGAYGVLAGLEVIRALADAEYVTRRPIEVAAWTNEEGCRFAPAMAGSGIFAGTHDEAELAATPDRDGLTFADELARIGYAGPEPVGGRDIAAFFEVHIEQGPILEAEERTIGIVSRAANPTPAPRRWNAATTRWWAPRASSPRSTRWERHTARTAAPPWASFTSRPIRETPFRARSCSRSTSATPMRPRLPK